MGKFVKDVKWKTEGRFDRLHLPVPASCSVCLRPPCWLKDCLSCAPCDLVLTYIRGVSRAGCLQTRNPKNHRRTRRIRPPRRDRISRSWSPRAHRTAFGTVIPFVRVVKVRKADVPDLTLALSREDGGISFSHTRWHCRIINKLVCSIY